MSAPKDKTSQKKFEEKTPVPKNAQTTLPWEELSTSEFVSEKSYYELYAKEFQAKYLNQSQIDQNPQVFDLKYISQEGD